MQQCYWKWQSFILNFISNILPSLKYLLDCVRCVCRKECTPSRKVAVKYLVLNKFYHKLQMPNVMKIC
jgi:hypothetical protein